MKTGIRIQKFEVFILIIALAIYSCNSNKKENVDQININKKKSEFVYLNIRLPFESSNNIYEDEINFELLNSQKEIIKSEFDTVTKTGGSIGYLLKKGIYNYSIKTPFNEKISKTIEVDRDTSFSFYTSCYKKVDEFSIDDLKNAEKINISVTYEFSNQKSDELEIEKKRSKSVIRFREKGNWSNEILIEDSSRIRDIIKEFENSIIRLKRNEVVGTEELSYITASQVFIKYGNKLFEVHNIKNDSLLMITNKLKQSLNKIL